MAVFEHTPAPRGFGQLASRATAALAGIASAILNWDDARVSARSLGGLTDRQLYDLGMHRGDIESFTRTVRRR